MLFNDRDLILISVLGCTGTDFNVAADCKKKLLCQTFGVILGEKLERLEGGEGVRGGEHNG